VTTPSSSFKDHFSRSASDYASFRPTYPAELFQWLASIVPSRQLAWDCACGNGQATTKLADHFDRVIGTDASSAQIQHAPSHTKIDWRVAPAENSDLPPASIDLITVAQALHWFDLDAFYAEARRTARPRAVLALWTYGLNTVETDSINAIVEDYYTNIVGPFWPPERKIVEEGYRTIPFPFEEITAPAFAMATHWNLEQLLSYFGTWSATNRFREAKKQDPIPNLRTNLAQLWGRSDQLRQITWPLALRVGRIH
jgi:ubiquinone/menaquinone biosynthesis C-methylase UbiE